MEATEKAVNRQLYENSKLAALFEEQGPIDPAEGFFNQLEPNLAILHEKPHHRLILLLKLRGLTNNEIAEQSGFTVSWVSQIVRQPWAVATMAKLSAEAGAASIHGLLESEAVPSIMKLVELRDNADTPSAVVRSACDSLLDRFLGKPAQHVDVVEHKAGMDAESVQQLDAELTRLHAEEQQLMGHN